MRSQFHHVIDVVVLPSWKRRVVWSQTIVTVFPAKADGRLQHEFITL